MPQYPRDTRQFCRRITRLLAEKHEVTHKMQERWGGGTTEESAVSIGSISLTMFNRPILSGKISLFSSTAISASNMLGRAT